MIPTSGEVNTRLINIRGEGFDVNPPTLYVGPTEMINIPIPSGIDETITNEKKDSGNFVETTETLVKDFLEGRKDYKNFKVKGVGNKQLVENKIYVNSVYKDFSVITPCESTPELAVSIKDSKIIFKIKPDITGYSGNLQFFIVDKNDYNWLFETLDVNLDDIQLRGSVEKSLNYNFKNIERNGQFEFFSTSIESYLPSKWLK